MWRAAYASWTPPNQLVDLTERTHIISSVDGPLMTEDGKTYTRLSPDTVVSHEHVGLSADMMKRLADSFPRFLEKALAENPLKAEFFLPTAVDGELRAGARDRNRAYHAG